jgi:hypothetical protein
MPIVVKYIDQSTPQAMGAAAAAGDFTRDRQLNAEGLRNAEFADQSQLQHAQFADQQQYRAAQMQQQQQQFQAEQDFRWAQQQQQQQLADAQMRNQAIQRLNDSAQRASALLSQERLREDAIRAQRDIAGMRESGASDRQQQGFQQRQTLQDDQQNFRQGLEDSRQTFAGDQLNTREAGRNARQQNSFDFRGGQNDEDRQLRQQKMQADQEYRDAVQARMAAQYQQTFDQRGEQMKQQQIQQAQMQMDRAHRARMAALAQQLQAEYHRKQGIDPTDTANIAAANDRMAKLEQETVDLQKSHELELMHMQSDARDPMLGGAATGDLGMSGVDGRGGAPIPSEGMSFGGGAGAVAAVQVQSISDYNALPPGTPYIDPDGNTRIKQ